MNFTLEDWEQLLSNIEGNTNPNFDEGAVPNDFGSALLPENNPLDFKETEEAIFNPSTVKTPTEPFSSSWTTPASQP